MSAATGRTVLHGVDSSVPTHADLPTKGNMASLCMVEDGLGFWVYDLDNTAWKPFETITIPIQPRVTGLGVGWYGTDVWLPEGTIIWDGVFEIAESFTSGGGATLLIKAESASGAAGDILAATAVTSLTESTPLVIITPVGTVATAVRLTSTKEMKFQIAVADLLTGEGYLHLRCFRGHYLTDQSSSSSSSLSSSSSSSSSVSASSVSESSVSSSSSSSSSSMSRSSQSLSSVTMSASSMSSQTTSSSSSSSLSASSSSSLSSSSSSLTSEGESSSSSSSSSG